jgi:hypothetical protein
MFTEAALKADPKDARALLLAAMIAHDRMVMAGTIDLPAEALEQAGKAAVQLERLMALEKLDSHDIKEAAYMYSNIAVTASENRRFEDAIRYGRRALELAARIESGAGNRSLPGHHCHVPPGIG